MENYYNDELQHWGIKGMKWGIRRYQNADGTLTAAGKKRYQNPDGTLNDAGKRKYGESSDDHKAAKDIKKKRVDQMSNAELKKLNERTRLEQEYDKLHPNTIKKGWKYVGAAVGIMGTTLAFYNSGTQVVNLGKKAVKAMLEVTTDTAHVAKKYL